MNDSKVVADYTDPEPILSGRVGYAAKRLSWGGNYFIRYISSSWEGKDPPAKLVPANYLAWNSTPVGVDFNPPASGSWLGSFWSRDSSKSAPGSWTSGRSALFAGPSGTYAVNVPAAGATVDTMRFESNTYTVSGPGALTNTGYSGRIYVNAAQATVSARLTGTGGLTKLGAGTLRLGSAAADSTNTYTGATVISAGSVVAVKNGALGTGAVTASAAGTQLQLNGGVTLPNAITIGARNLYSLGSGTGNMLSGGVSLTGTMDTIQVDNALSMSGVVSGGASGITKTGTAQLTLSNDNTYTGVTNVRGGNLQIGSGGATGNLTGTGGINVAAGTGVIFNRSNAFTYDGVISGAGGVTKSGAGTLTLSGANSYTGATAINAGGVTITTAANIGSGPITVNGTLTVNNTANIDLNRQLSGTGTFVKSGAGTLTLPAAASVGVRNVSVGAGVLTANAALAVDSIAVGSGARINGASLGKDGSSKIMVNGGTLAGGTGYNGAVTLTGTSVSPGTIIHDAANLLQIDGPFTMNANSRISAPIRALSSILVTGALTLGGALNITTTPAAPIAEGIYKIINYHGAASGNFAAFTVDGSSPPAAYTFKTEVSGGYVTLTITPKGGGAEVIRNYFQVDSVKYLGDVAAGSEVTVFMSGLNGIRDYLNALNGASAQTVSILYNPGSAATSMPNAAGTVPIALPASGNVYSATVTVPSPSDALYFFNVATTWVMNGTAPLVRDTTYSAGKSVYPRNPKNAILKNGFSIAVALKSSSASGLSYDLTVAGQNDELLTPGVDYKPAVDSVGIWFRRNGSMPALSGNALNRAAVGAAADSLMVFPLSRLRSSGAIGFSTKAVANATFDTVYFAIAPRWKGAGITDSIARDLYVTTRSEPNPSRKQPNNDCYLDAVQEDKRSPVVNAALRTSEPFNEVARTVLVEFSLTPSMADIISTKSYTAAEVESGSAEFSLSNAAFAGEERLVYYRITVLGDDSGLRAENTGSFTVGRKAPLPLIGFTATPVGGTPDKGWSMSLSWNAVTPEANGVDDLASCEIRIIYSADPITEATADFTVAGTYAAVGAGSNSYTVNGLEKETNYWFAAVLADGSLMSAAEVRMENTGSGTLVANIVEIDSVLFNSDAANFKVYFRLTEKNENHTYSYYVTLGSDEVLAASAPQAFRISAVDAVDSLVTGSLGSSLVFDTVYTVHMYVFDAAGNESPIRSVGAVRIGPFEKQTIMVPIGGGSASADNGALKLSAVGWSEGLNAVAACTTAVSASTAGASKAGFEFLGNYGYSYKVTNDAAWVNVMGPFTISIAAGEIPSPYTTDDVRIYRWKEANNYWEVVYNTKYDNGYFTGTAIDSVGKEAGSTYRLMVSTTRPAITRLTTGTLGPVDASRSYSEHYDITSDVGNFRINMIVGPAGESSPSIIEPTPSSETTGTRRSVTYEIGTSVLRDAANRGVFAYLIATDGRNSDTLNSSRQVLSTSYGGFPIADQKEKKWYPFAAQVELDDKSVRKALGEFYHDDDEFKTYDTLYRLFRWYQTPDNRNDQNKWVEFKSDIKNDSLFDMEPGRLMWFKSAQYTLLEFGSATSTSLTETVEIRLPAEQWTDFVLPFRFNICLGDILEATVGAEGNIAFYKWIEPQSSKQKQSYITDMIMLTGADSIELKGGSDPYTVHNQSKSDVILRIPPKPSFLSSYSASNRRSAGLSKTAAAARAQAANDVWYYKIRTGTDNASELSSVLVGYSQTDRSFAVPPSFNNEAVVLVDSAGAEIGHHFGPAIARGRSYRLRFYNDDKQRSTFTFYAQPSANAPSNAQITFVKASTGEILGSRGASAQQSVSVAGMSHEDVFMIVGNSAYRAKTAAGPAGAKFKVSSISVNRAARSARINYYVPAAGIDRVEVSIYDIKGRQLWKNTQRVKAAAWNVTEWNSRQSKRGAVSAGLYIVRVKAVNGTGRVVGVDSKRVTFAR